MRNLRVLAPVGVGLAVLLGAAFSYGRSAPVPNVVDQERDARTVEVRRIRAHFDSVLAEVEARDVAALGASQRDNRRMLLATLSAYRDRGVFPHNYDFPGEAVPYFVDHGTGTLCAVGHLLASSGRRDIVDRVARTDNNVRVAQLAGDTAFTAWLDANGLTLAEAAWIQPKYQGPPLVVATQDRKHTPVALPVAMGASALAGAWNTFANANGQSSVATAIGFGSGLAAVGLGASYIGRESVPRAMSITTAAVGGLSVALSARSLHRHNVIEAAEREAARKTKVSDATISPIIPVGGSGAGVSVSLRF